MEGTFSKISNNIEYDYITIARPGHGAPTQDIRKKKFTEHQMNNLTRSQSLFGLDSEVPGLPDPAPISRFT